ncbi:MAG: MFS transporter [Pseudomonadota bacterium]
MTGAAPLDAPGAGLFARFRKGFGPWVTILRFGVVQSTIGAMTVLPITTLPRLVQNEIGLLATAAGLLIGVYYAAQISRLRFGVASDLAHRRTPFVVGGLITLGVSSVAAAYAIRLMDTDVTLGYLAAALAYMGVGVGVGAAGTPLLTLLATTVAPARRAPAATIVWLMMIFGLGLTAALAGNAMSPFTFSGLTDVAIVVSLIAVTLGTVTLIGLEGPRTVTNEPEPAKRSFTGLRETMAALSEIWHEPQTRGFAVFVFVSMFAYNMQEVVTETFLGTIFGLDAGLATVVSGYQKFGALAGLIAAAVLGAFLKGTPRALVTMTIGGCLFSALSLVGLGLSSYAPASWPIEANVAAFGLGNGLFAGGAVASMFSLAGIGTADREGTRMGAFGVAQGFGFGLGLFAGATQLDIARATVAIETAFASVFFVESAIFVVAAILALRLSRAPELPKSAAPPIPA